jgi:hypothetical protein
MIPPWHVPGVCYGILMWQRRELTVFAFFIFETNFGGIFADT